MIQSPVQKKKKIISSEDLLASPKKQPAKAIQRNKMDINLSFKELNERNRDSASQSSKDSKDEKMPIEVTIAKARKPAGAPNQQKKLLESPPKKIPVKKTPMKKVPVKVHQAKKQIQKAVNKKEQITIVDSDDDEKLPIEGKIYNSSYENN
ncbi:unnamed protein product [Oikopleura dioica]|uniref:Uncharacterized protein n=1 Tax=Oikopleura dioica TaxID=34765 RepID=E4Z145_OIKDI|nr:unnamed protein product [Oikopleura dioica]